MITVLGAGAMGAALAVCHARAGNPTTLLGTRFDQRIVEALQGGGPHPVLGVPLPFGTECRGHDEWGDALANSELVVIGVATPGLADVVQMAAQDTAPDSTWVIATKGWDEGSLRSPSEVVADVRGGMEHLAILGGPALAQELVTAAPTAMVCAASNLSVAEDVCRLLQSAQLSVQATDDVAGVETASAYKNVTAVAVGMCEGLSESLSESAFVHTFANARAAVFARGLEDMTTLALARGGRASTILGLAGAGDLFVTCLGGRNGRLGRLLGVGESPAQAEATIGSTVEGVANARVAVTLADRLGLDLPTARAVDDVLSERISPEKAVRRLFHSFRASPDGSSAR